MPQVLSPGAGERHGKGVAEGEVAFPGDVLGEHDALRLRGR